MCPIEKLQKQLLGCPVSDFTISHKICNIVTAQYQKKKQKSISGKHKTLFIQSWLIKQDILHLINYCKHIV